MTDYTKTVNFAAKDSLSTGDSNKIVRGTEINTEFDNIATAIATKLNSSGAVFTNPVSFPDGSASSPAFTNTGDTNCGLFFSAADTLAFTAGGTAQFTMADGVIAPVTDNDVDLGTSSLQFKDAYINGTANIDSLALTSGATVTIIADEDNMSSNSATSLATQQSIKAYVDSEVSGSGSMSNWVLEDGDGTEVTISNAKEVKFVEGGGIDIDWTDTDNGTDGDPYDLTFTVNAAQTGITSLLATDIKIGEDDQTKIDFETADEIHFYAANVEQVYLGDNIFGPQSDSDVDLGSTSVRWKDAFVDSITVTGEIDGDSLDIEGDADINGTTNLDAVDIDGAVQIDATVTVGVDDTGYDVKFFGATSGKYMEWDESADQLEVVGTATVDGTLQLKNGSTSAGKIEFFEDSDNGTNKVTLIGPASTSDITLTLPSSDGDDGQVLTTDGSGTLSFATVGGAYNTWLVKTGNYTALVGDQIIVNSSSATTITLPASASAGNTVIIKATGGGTVTVGRNSQNINSSAEDGTLASGNATQLVYVDGTIGFLEV